MEVNALNMRKLIPTTFLLLQQLSCNFMCKLIGNTVVPPCQDHPWPKKRGLILQVVVFNTQSGTLGPLNQVVL